MFMSSCGGVARENGTYFVNPNHPETTDVTGSCQLTILKMHPEICQIRLDFEQFALAGLLTKQILKLLQQYSNNFQDRKSTTTFVTPINFSFPADRMYRLFAESLTATTVNKSNQSSFNQLQIMYLLPPQCTSTQGSANQTP